MELIILAIFVTGLLYAINRKPKKSKEWAERERDSEQLDWMVRGGTHEGWNPQNSPLLDRKRNWKPGIRIVEK